VVDDDAVDEDVEIVDSFLEQIFSNKSLLKLIFNFYFYILNLFKPKMFIKKEHKFFSLYNIEECPFTIFMY
jgi:heme oxygenase